MADDQRAGDDALRDALVRYGLPTTADVSVLIRHIEANRALAHEADRQAIAMLTAEVERLRLALERMTLAYIEVANPGIDMEQVRASREGQSKPTLSGQPPSVSHEPLGPETATT